jgi:hypothetical protein
MINHTQPDSRKAIMNLRDLRLAENSYATSFLILTFYFVPPEECYYNCRQREDLLQRYQGFSAG